MALQCQYVRAERFPKKRLPRGRGQRGQVTTVRSLQRRSRLRRDEIIDSRSRAMSVDGRLVTRIHSVSIYKKNMAIEFIILRMPAGDASRSTKKLVAPRRAAPRRVLLRVSPTCFASREISSRMLLLTSPRGGGGGARPPVRGPWANIERLWLVGLPYRTPRASWTSNFVLVLRAEESGLA